MAEDPVLLHTFLEFGGFKVMPKLPCLVSDKPQKQIKDVMLLVAHAAVSVERAVSIMESIGLHETFYLAERAPEGIAVWPLNPANKGGD